MKLLVILLCLASERYLVHAASLYRYHWFHVYFNGITRYLPKTGYLGNQFIVLAIIVLPVLLAVWGILVLTGDVLYGFVGLLLNLIIFYLCLGPDNPFYPVSQSDEDSGQDESIENYFSKVNNQLFAVIFWFIVTGPLGVLFYRLLYICKDQELTKFAATWITAWLDWVTARVTVLLYLLVGNFQQGFQYYTRMFLSSPETNDELLKKGGLLAAQTREEDSLSLPYVQSLVEHALLVFLVFLAFFTLVAWL